MVLDFFKKYKFENQNLNKLIIVYNFRKNVAGMRHRRSAHALAKVSNLSNVEDFVYEYRKPSLEVPEIS